MPRYVYTSLCEIASSVSRFSFRLFPVLDNLGDCAWDCAGLDRKVTALNWTYQVYDGRILPLMALISLLFPRLAQTHCL
jgi:hypothetical protein